MCDYHHFYLSGNKFYDINLVGIAKRFITWRIFAMTALHFP